VHHFDAAAREVSRQCLDYALERLAYDPVDLDHPRPFSELAEAVGETITPEGRPADDVLALWRDVLAPACISTDSPHFFAFIPGAPTKASLVFDTVVAASSINASSWLEASGAVYAENQTLRFLADVAGLPATAGGCFVSGGSAGNLSALVVGREQARRRRGRGRTPGRVAVGAEAHSSVAATLRIIDADPLIVPSDERDRLTGGALQAVLERDPDPESVFAVVATAGTTNAGVIDDLSGIAEVARQWNLWFHVDAAYGGAALCAPSARPRFNGIEDVDSLVIDPHKWLFAPFDSCALLYREPELARTVHAQEASYLDAIRVGGEWNPADYAYHLSRRARGLPFWFSLAVHGTDAYAAAIEQALATTQQAVARIQAAPHVELLREPELSVLLFERPGWDPTDYVEWSRRLLDEQRAFVLPTRWKGRMVGRAVFLHPHTTVEMFDNVLDAML
jgi:aromatic-L-amino-acid/L-tryptophan decarboxylase